MLREDAEAIAAGMPEQLRALVLLAFWGGLRLGELLGLQYGDLELDPSNGEGSVRIERQQQADSVRTVHLPEPVVTALLEHLARAGDVLPTARLFTRQNGQLLRAWDAQRYWRRARTAADLPAEMAHLHIHDLRHGGLTLATQSGASLAEVMRRAGHASSRAAMIYQHAAEDRDATVAARMASVAGTTKTRRARGGHAKIISLPRASETVDESQ